MKHFLSPADKKAHHAQQHEQEVEGLGAQVLFTEEPCAHTERHEHAAAPHHRHYGNHGVGMAQSIEIGKIGGSEEKGNKHNAPLPCERLRLPAPAGGQP